MIRAVNEIKTVDNYPYGRLKTKATFSLEFSSKKGFRSVFQTINPKTGRINKPKKGVYHEIMYMSDTDGFIKFHAREFYKIEEFNNVTDFLFNNFSLFNEEQRKYLYSKVVSFLKLQMYVYKVYCNVETEKSLEIVKEPMKLAIEGFKNPNNNIFNLIKLDHVKLEALKDPNYNPFTVTSHTIGA